MTENTTLQSIKRWFQKENEHSVLNVDAFTRLYEETYLIVFRYVYGLSSGPLQESEDLTAETYARAWKTRQGFHGDGQAALGWLLRIARNLAIDLSRRRKVQDVPVIFPTVPGDGVPARVQVALAESQLGFNLKRSLRHLLLGRLFATT